MIEYVAIRHMWRLASKMWRQEVFPGVVYIGKAQSKSFFKDNSLICGDSKDSVVTNMTP